MLAFQPETRIAAVIRAGLKPFTEHTMTQAGRLRKELRLIRASGYAVNRQEWRGDVCGLAAPVWNHQNGVEASISITTPASRFDEEQFRALVVATARQVSEAMGWPGAGTGARSLRQWRRTRRAATGYQRRER